MFRRSALLIGIGLVATATGWLGVVLTPPGPLLIFFDNLHWTAGFASGALLAWHQAVRNAAVPSVARWTAFGLASLTLGQVIWDIQIFVGWLPFPGPSDVFYLATGLLVATGVWRAIRQHLDTQGRRILLLDTAMLLIGTLTASSLIFLPRQGAMSGLQIAVMMAYPFSYMLPAFLSLNLVFSLYALPRWRCFAFPLVLAAFAGVWIEWNLRFISSQLLDGDWLNVCFSLAAILTGLSAGLYSLDVRQQHRLPGYESIVRQLPLVMVGVGSTALATPLLLPLPDHIAWSISLGGISTIVIALARQTLLLRERDLLLAERAEAEAHIEYLAYHDPLTELPNRQLAREHFDLAKALAARNHRKVGLLFVDLDNFKVINDTLGHGIGDALLKAASARLRACIAHSDTVSRQGGDEFLILLSDIAGPDEAARSVEVLLQGFAAPFVIEGHSLATSLSIGVALYPDDGEALDTLLMKADTAMYQAKSSGRNTYRFYNEHMSSDAMDRLQIQNHLREALEYGEFVLHYQPQIDIASGEVIGAEALVRWQNPALGLVAPARFIPLAEESGMIVALGEWILFEACRQAAAWRQAGLPRMTIAINISAVQFRHHSLESSVTQALLQSGLDPACLELELTESILIGDADAALSLVHKLKAIGVKLSIDDFGTGYSSLAYLKRIKVDKLKIDQSFVRNMATDPDDAAIVQAIIQVAATLKLKTLAEGVEDGRTLTRLHLQRCDEAQGYWFARPMPAEEFADYLRQHMPPA